MMKIAVIDKAVRAASFQERIDELLKSGTVTLDQLAMTNAQDPLERTHINIDDSTDLSRLAGKEFDMVICDEATADRINEHNGVSPAMVQALTKQERVLWYSGDRPSPRLNAPTIVVYDEVGTLIHDDTEVLVLDSVEGCRFMKNSEWLKEYVDVRPMVQEEANRLAAQDHDRVITRLARNSVRGKLAPRASSEVFESAYQAHERRIRVGKGQRKANRHNRWS